MICTSFSNGKKHDFRLFKESKVRWTRGRSGITDSGYTGIKKLQSNTKLPKKSGKKKPLTREEKEQNRQISSERVVNENVIGSLKRFKIITHLTQRQIFHVNFLIPHMQLDLLAKSTCISMQSDSTKCESSKIRACNKQ